jgi:hypothetical protein
MKLKSLKNIFITIQVFATLCAHANISTKFTQISSTLEQPKTQITKSFSLRVKDIRKIRLKANQKVKLIDFYYENTNGHIRSVKLNNIIDRENNFETIMERTNIKKVTFTAISLSEVGSPVIDLQLIP